MNIVKNLSIFFIGVLSILNSFSIVDLSNAIANATIVQSNGYIVVAGSANIGGVTQALVARYTNTGALDSTFNGGAVTTVVGESAVFNGVIQQSDGKIVAVGSANLTTNPQYIVVRYNTNGTLDTTFGNQGISTSVQGASSIANAIAQQSNGQLVIVGTSSIATGVARYFTARLNGNGTLDTTFGSNGSIIAGYGTLSIATNVLIQPSNQYIIVTGYGAANYLAVRYTTTGSIDTTFGNSGIFSGVFGGNVTQCFDSVLQSDGKIVLGGFSANNFGLMRITSAGVIDTSYGTSGNGQITVPFTVPAAIYSLALQTNGYVVAVGAAGNQLALARITSNGVLDGTYGTSGTVTTTIGSMARGLGAALQSNGEVVVAGYSAPNLFVTLYTTSGTVDSGFGVVTSPLTCSTALCAYGQVYNLSAVDILNNAAFTFDSDGVLQNVSHPAGSSDVVLGLAGIYLATYIVEIQGNSLLQLQLNGNMIPGSNYLSPNTCVTVGKAIFAANAGDTLNLVNVTGYDQPLLSGGVNASITVEKIA